MSDFTPYEVVLRVRANDTYEALLKCWIKSAADEENLRQSKGGVEHYWSKRSAPLNKVPKEGSGAAQARRSISPVAHGLNSTPLQEAELGRLERSSSSQKVKLELGLSRLREIIADLAEDITKLDGQLVPYWCAQNGALASIRATHEYSPNGTLRFTSATAAERKPIFDRLLTLAMQWGPVKTERAQLNTRMKGYEREAKQIETTLAALRRKQRIKQHAQT